MISGGSGAVFFLGSRAHYQVLEQPNNCDAENGNTSAETVYQNASVEELWPKQGADENNDLKDANCNTTGLGWSFSDHGETALYDRPPLTGSTKRRGKRSSSEALLCADVQPAGAALNLLDDNSNSKPKPSRRVSVLSFLTSLGRRKPRLESSQIHYLHHLDSVLNTCTYRESCRCLDCQSRYFECAEESDSYSSDEDYSPYSQEIDAAPPQVDDDEVFIDPVLDNDNTSTDLLLEETSLPEEAATESLDDVDTDKQLQMEVAASTSAMFNLLLYHPFSCSIQ